MKTYNNNHVRLFFYLISLLSLDLPEHCFLFISFNPYFESSNTNENVYDLNLNIVVYFVIFNFRKNKFVSQYVMLQVSKTYHILILGRNKPN